MSNRKLKRCTDKVNLASIVRNFFFWKIRRQALVHRFRKKVKFPFALLSLTLPSSFLLDTSLFHSVKALVSNCFNALPLDFQSVPSGPRQSSPYLNEFTFLFTTKNTENTKIIFNKRFVLIFNGLPLYAIRGLQ